MRWRSALALLLPLTATFAVSGVTSAIARQDRPAAPVTVRRTTWDLRLNEVDYDQAGDDTGEFVEIVNMDDVRHRLRHVSLVFVNGTTSTAYRTIALHGRLGVERRLVVASGSVEIDPAARALPLPLSRDNVQNGSPDGIALVNVATGAVLDALSYEGSIDDATIDGVSEPVSLVAGHAVTEEDDNVGSLSLCRLPDHADTGDDEHDWGSCTPTPGAANAAAIR